MIWKLDEFLQSKKVKMSLIILGCTMIATLTGHCDGLAFAGVISSVAIIYNFSQSKTDVASMGMPPNPVPPSLPNSIPNIDQPTNPIGHMGAGVPPKIL